MCKAGNVLTLLCLGFDLTLLKILDVFLWQSLSTASTFFFNTSRDGDLTTFLSWYMTDLRCLFFFLFLNFYLLMYTYNVLFLEGRELEVCYGCI